MIRDSTRFEFPRRRVIHRLAVPFPSLLLFSGHRIMEMRLAPILILYYFPAEFSRHLYDNAKANKKIFPSPRPEEKDPCGLLALRRVLALFSRLRVPSRSQTEPRQPSLLPIVSPLEYASSVSRVDLVSPPSIFFAAPPITETDDTLAPPLPAAPSIFASANSDIRIFLSMRSPRISLFINHAGFTKIANLRPNVRAKRRKT